MTLAATIKFTLPDWAQWLAMDDDGRWHAFDAKPLPGVGMWYAYGKKFWVCSEPVSKKGTGWRKSLVSATAPDYGGRANIFHTDVK